MSLLWFWLGRSTHFSCVSSIVDDDDVRVQLYSLNKRTYIYINTFVCALESRWISFASELKQRNNFRDVIFFCFVHLASFFFLFIIILSGRCWWWQYSCRRTFCLFLFRCNFELAAETSTHETKCTKRSSMSQTNGQKNVLSPSLLQCNRKAMQRKKIYMQFWNWTFSIAELHYIVFILKIKKETGLLTIDHLISDHVHARAICLPRFGREYFMYAPLMSRPKFSN